ncbi:MAG TPA: hypothetical protein DCP97_01850 [Ruminococcaceae bacterium]|nr:hypothetical protein [Oscillospiraceae bacterium]
MVTQIYKHYIRLDSNNNIIKGFTTAFEQPLDADICINGDEDWGRHFRFEQSGKENPQIFSLQGISLYKYINGSIVAKTTEEIQSELDKTASAHKPASIEQRIADIEELMAAVMFGGAD